MDGAPSIHARRQARPEAMASGRDDDGGSVRFVPFDVLIVGTEGMNRAGGACARTNAVRGSWGL